MSQTDVTRADSLTEQDPHNVKEDKKQKSKRPANTAFRQQRLKAWQPILTPKTVLPFFFVVGVIFAPIGGLLIWASSQIEEIVIDYTKCTDAPTSPEKIPAGNVQQSFKSKNETADPMWWKNDTLTTHFAPGVDVPTTVCSLQFSIPNDIGPSVFMYYRMSNFYQNHRRYVKSLDLEQLRGKAKSKEKIESGTCDPLRVDPETNKPYYPCGLIANSVFNDTFSSPVQVGVRSPDGGNLTYPMTNKGIAWSSDKEVYKKTEYTWDQVSPPVNWRDRYPEYTADNPPPNIEDWEEFQVWMRTAGLPTFSKLAMRNDNQTMVAGTYRVDIRYFFPVTEFDGTKSLVISTNNVMGGKNPFLGIAYVVVGGICIVLGTAFTFAHLIRPRKLGDHTYLTWNNDQPSTATTTGRDPRLGGAA